MRQQWISGQWRFQTGGADVDESSPGVSAPGGNRGFQAERVRLGSVSAVSRRAFLNTVFLGLVSSITVSDFADDPIENKSKTDPGTWLLKPEDF